MNSTDQEIPSSSRINIAIFASGTGTNARKIIDHFSSHAFISVALLVCNKPGAGVITIAEQKGVPVLMIERERFLRDGYVAELKQFNIDLIALAGFLWKIPQPVIDAYRNKIINIHPALLPKFGGKGMYGEKVHQAAINAGEKESGITIHYVDEHYDNGDIIYQATCQISDDDSATTLAARIHVLEHEHYPRVIEEVIRQQLS